MYFIKNKKLIDSDGKVMLSVNDEIILTQDLIEDYFSDEVMKSALHSPYIIPLFKLILLNQDETEWEDVTHYIVNNGISYSHEYKSGQCRSVSTTFFNSDDSWLPNPVKGKNWSGTKFQLYMGMVYKNVVFWFPSGIYYLSNPTLNMNDDTASFELVDKFAMLDGSLGGTTETDYTINVNDLICDSISSLLKLDMRNTGDSTDDVFDIKPFLYPSSLSSEKTPYTLKKNPQSNIGEIIQELTQMLSCEIAYNESGYLEMVTSDELLQIDEKPIMLTITDKDIDISGVSITMDYTKIINKVTVVGANINGYLFDYTAINKNPSSPSNIYFTPPNFTYITDDNIYSDALCKERAEYELQKASFLGLSITIPLRIWCPFLKAGNLIVWNSERFNFKFVKFLINSVKISGDGDITLSITNTKELPF